MKKLTAKGKNIDGEEIEFEIDDGALYCWRIQLTELTIPMGVTYVFCYGNKITHLDLPSSVTYLRADKEVIGLERYIGKIDMNLL